MPKHSQEHHKEEHFKRCQLLGMHALCRSFLTGWFIVSSCVYFRVSSQPNLLISSFCAFLNTVLHLHSQKTLLSQDDLIDKCKNSKPENRCNINSKSGWDLAFHYFEQPLGRPCNHYPWKIIELCVGIPRRHNSAELMQVSRKRCELNVNNTIPFDFVVYFDVFFAYHGKRQKV